MTLVMALLLGAASIWVMQSDSGYILLSFNNTTVEMTVWVGILLYLTVTGLGAWLLLLFLHRFYGLAGIFCAQVHGF